MAVVVVLAAVSALAPVSPAAPSVTSGVQLEGVSADSATDAWAVGNTSGDPPQGVIFHWDGQSLSRFPDEPQGQLFGVSADSPTDAWAVGSYAVPRAHVVQTVVLHWNGSAWSAVQGPNPGSFLNELDSVRAISSTDVWALGYFIASPGGPHKLLVAHWNGTTWSQFGVPAAVAKNLLVTRFQTFDPVSATSVYAIQPHVVRLPHGVIKSDEILHWNGSSWSKTGCRDLRRRQDCDPSFFGAELSGVSAVSNSDVWAAGYTCPGLARYHYRCPPFRALTLHRGGNRWRYVPNPGLEDSRVYNVTAQSSSNVWAVGRHCAVANTRGRTDNCSRPETLIMRWNGDKWFKVRSPGSSLSFGLTTSVVSPVSSTDAWVLGKTSDGSTALLHWDGSAWTRL
jgi:hypothetical protein